MDSPFPAYHSLGCLQNLLVPKWHGMISCYGSKFEVWDNCLCPPMPRDHEQHLLPVCVFWFGIWFCASPQRNLAKPCRGRETAGLFDKIRLKSHSGFAVFCMVKDVACKTPAPRVFSLAFSLLLSAGISLYMKYAVVFKQSLFLIGSPCD